jgi:hypothetical protein
VAYWLAGPRQFLNAEFRLGNKDETLVSGNLPVAFGTIDLGSPNSSVRRPKKRHSPGIEKTTTTSSPSRPSRQRKAWLATPDCRRDAFATMGAAEV